jgi:polyisoprenoid-binding protein YceI
LRSAAPGGGPSEEDDMAQTAEQLRQDRTYEGIAMPPAGTYSIDPDHTSIEFVARHMLSKVRGSFSRFAGSIVVGEAPGDSAIQVEVDTSSVTTGSEQRDQHLHSSDFFEVETHPQMTFTSRSFRPTGGTGFEIAGDLTIKGITKPVTLKGDFLGSGKDGWGNDRLFAEARSRVNREDWGLLWNMAVELTGVLVAKDVDLEIQVQAVRTPEG